MRWTGITLEKNFKVKCKAVTGSGKVCTYDTVLSGYCLQHFYMYVFKEKRKKKQF